MPIPRALLFAAVLPAAAALAAEKTVIVSPEVRVTVTDGSEIFLSARPLANEGVEAFVKRLTDDPRARKEILGKDSARGSLRRDVFYRVPYLLLSPSYRKIAIEAVFPEDSADSSGWTHRVAAISGRPETLWRIAEWFTGDGRRYREIRDAGRIASLETEKGQVIRIPTALLLPVFRTAAAAQSPPPVPLEFAADGQGRYGLYRLQKGEALYSAVVVRFTGRVHAEDVNDKASQIARRSGIEDVRAIPVGYPVKIPIEDLAPEFRPPGDPERVEEENARLEAAQFANRVRAIDLSGVTVVLDAGHGGRDTGAIVEGVQEARQVYDLACRVEALLTRHTKARVVRTVKGQKSCSRSRPEGDSDWQTARVLTTPPYDLEDAIAGVNFRWYLANSVFRRVSREGGSEERTVFVSIHADSLHPAVRGLMVYVPGEKFLRGTYGKSGAPYDSRREVREEPRVSFTRRERIQAEGMSRDLAERIVGAFRATHLPLHDFQPVRQNVIRSGREWVPAILRYNRIPARVLVEVCNLNNPDDRKLLIGATFRDRVARALVSGLVEFYGGRGRDVLTTAGSPRPAEAPEESKRSRDSSR
jgi:N-acetylmuramoyl-L-alanine amidase